MEEAALAGCGGLLQLSRRGDHNHSRASHRNSRVAMEPRGAETGILLIEAFFETAAPRAANVVLVIEIAMGLGLLVGARLAREGRFRQHAWCQSSIVLLNLAVVAVMMIPSFRVHVLPRVPAKL